MLFGIEEERPALHDAARRCTTLHDAARRCTTLHDELSLRYIRGTVFARCHPRPYYSPDRNIPVAEVLKLRGVEIAREWA
jgi:hypothetical protein